MKEIQLTRGFVALVDDGDYDRVTQFDWHVNLGARSPRAVARIGGKLIYMHQFITGAKKGVEVDHRDRNTLNNRRKNLRSATKSQNMANTVKRLDAIHSKFKGVTLATWVKGKNRWRAGIQVAKRRLHLGYHERETDAAKAYDRAARRLFGEFAQLNFT